MPPAGTRRPQYAARRLRAGAGVGARRSVSASDLLVVARRETLVDLVERALEDRAPVALGFRLVEALLVLLSGRMRIYNLTPDGKLVTLSLCRPEDPGLLGDTEYLTGEKAPSHVEAVADAVLLEVRFDRERMEEDIALYRFLARMQLYKMQQVSRDAIRQAMSAVEKDVCGDIAANVQYMRVSEMPKA